jgi:hypothetical protein
MLDGMLLQRIEAGESFRPAELERQALAVLDLILAAARTTGQQREPAAR